MKIDFCIRGNGACPLCQRNGKCEYQERIINALKPIPLKGEGLMEMVIYTCPSFVERI